jgi:hypothetical protein
MKQNCRYQKNGTTPEIGQQADFFTTVFSRAEIPNACGFYDQKPQSGGSYPYRYARRNVSTQALRKAGVAALSPKQRHDSE